MSYRPVFAFVLACAAFGQPAQKPSFEVASVKASAPLDPQKLMAIMKEGGKLPVGVRVDGARAEYLSMPLLQLITAAYKVKPYQVTGPDWMTTTMFDIQAKLPEGATKESVPQMLQSLLEE